VVTPVPEACINNTELKNCIAIEGHIWPSATTLAIWYHCY